MSSPPIPKCKISERPLSRATMRYLPRLLASTKHRPRKPLANARTPGRLMMLGAVTITRSTQLPRAVLRKYFSWVSTSGSSGIGELNGNRSKRWDRSYSPMSQSFAPHIFESGKFLQKSELDRTGRTVALFADDQLSLALIVVRRIVDLFPKDETHHVAVLFDRAAFSQVAQLWLVLAALLGRA